jgi:exopolyphosphatase/guanosine-5'-triphosphate,3'-diphosphate pyrophosphatase
MTPRAVFIDIGTNTILCLIAELRGGGRFRVLDDLAEITRLGQGVDQTSKIGPEGEERSAQVLQRYLRHCRDLGVEEILAVGTSAFRDAANSSEVRARFKRRLGLDIRVLSGQEEAAYSFLAVQKGLNLSGHELMVIDIGGGSTEFIWGNDSGIRRAVSINVGSVRLTERFLRSDPVTEQECGLVREAIDRQLNALREAASGHVPAVKTIGIAGTFTTLAAVEKKLARYSHRDVHGSRVALTEVRRQRKLFQTKTLLQRKKIPGLDPLRADVILAGAILIERIMKYFRIDHVMVSDQGVRYGLLHERLKRTLFC